MKKHKLNEIMPDVGTEVLGYFEEGFIVVYYLGGDWVEPWNGNVMPYPPEYWVDLPDVIN